jgi:ribosomal protein S18 acetylase RimI-like enzyme
MAIIYRRELKPADRLEIRKILESTNVFYDFEVDIAIEIVDDFLERGEESGYYFIVAESEDKVLGYVNYGPVPCTQTSWDVYWIAVSKDTMNRGIGKVLMKMAEDNIHDRNGINVWVETASRADYAPTRAFYHRVGYTVAAELTDFYSPGDNKVIFHKKV